MQVCHVVFSDDEFMLYTTEIRRNCRVSSARQQVV